MRCSWSPVYGRAAPRLRIESVAHTGFRVQVPGLGRIPLQLSPQLGYVDAQVLRFLRVCLPPDLSEDLLLAHELPLITDQQLQDVPFGGRQAHFRAILENLL